MVDVLFASMSVLAINQAPAPPVTIVPKPPAHRQSVRPGAALPRTSSAVRHNPEQFCFGGDVRKVPNRILRDGILTSSRIQMVGPLAELFYRRLMSVVDDYGRYYGNLSLLLSGCFPACPQWATREAMASWLEECESAGLILRYSAKNTDYVEIVDFGQRTRAVSKFPEPPDGDGSTQPSGKVYFLRSTETGNIKIGFTEWKPELRMMAIQSEIGQKLEMLGWCAATRKDEGELHKQFSLQSVGNEWFTSSEELLQLIARKSPHLRDKKALARATTTTTTTTTEGGAGGNLLAVRILGQQHFERMIGAFLAAGVALNEQDRMAAATEWVSLGDTHWERATAFAEALARSSEAQFMGLPKNFLKKQPWTRAGPGRLLPPPINGNIRMHAIDEMLAEERAKRGG